MALRFPTQKDVLDTIELLIGEKPTFQKGEGWDLTAPPAGAYITFLQAKDNTVAGAVVTDLPVTLHIGGKLILLPEATLKDMFAEQQADEQIIDAINEVVNNLRTLFNSIGMNPHVAPTKTYAYQVPGPNDFVSWILAPRKRIDYVTPTPFGAGTLTLLGA